MNLTIYNLTMNLTIYNLMSASGFKGGMAWPFFTAWIGLAFLVLIGMFAKKWLGEEEIVGRPYNWVASILGVVAYIIVVTFTGSAKISLLVGLGVGLAAGFTVGSTVE